MAFVVSGASSGDTEVGGRTVIVVLLRRAGGCLREGIARWHGCQRNSAWMKFQIPRATVAFASTRVPDICTASVLEFSVASAGAALARGCRRSRGSAARARRPPRVSRGVAPLGLALAPSRAAHTARVPERVRSGLRGTRATLRRRCCQAGASLSAAGARAAISSARGCTTALKSERASRAFFARRWIQRATESFAQS